MSFNFSSFQAQVQKALEHTQTDINTLRTGRATTQLLDPVTVEAYGTHMKIAEVASITAPDANMILVAPWDKSLLGAIEKGISIANLNLSPVVDGQVVRIVVPALTEETRREMVKVLQQKLEAARIMVRSIRTDTKKDIEKQEGQPGISEDNIEEELEELEKRVKEVMAQIDDVGVRKEKELMTV